MIRRVVPWLAVGLLTLACTAASLKIADARYREFRSGYAWDLSYYNQWFWALTQGDGQISVRPDSAYATEGPSVWKMNYLAPVRFLIVPFYLAFPGPETLLAVQCVVFWWTIPAGYVLARSESGSRAIGLVAAALIPATPLLWPLALNDFRELQLAIPFVIWAIAGWRGRNAWLAGLGIGGMLACRQEYALMVASLAIIPGREAEPLARSYRWGRAAIAIGLGWFLFGFFGYLSITAGPESPRAFINQFGGPKPAVLEIGWTSWQFLTLGMGAWGILALFAPRVALISVPWIYSLATGKWTMDWISTVHWHHVRYTAPAAALVLAAGLIGFARVARRGKVAFGLASVACLGISGFAGSEMFARFARVPVLYSRGEQAAIWRWIREVRPEEGVTSAYEVTAPLSSRRHLYSYMLDQNRPPDRPEMKGILRWMLLDAKRFPVEPFVEGGLKLVHRGENLLILHRGSPESGKSRKSAE